MLEKRGEGEALQLNCICVVLSFSPKVMGVCAHLTSPSLKHDINSSCLSLFPHKYQLFVDNRFCLAIAIIVEYLKIKEESIFV